MSVKSNIKGVLWSVKDTFGSRFKRLRKDRELTQEQIAAVRMLQTADVGLMVAKLPFDARKKTLTDYHRNSISGKYLKAPCTKLLQA